MTQSGCITCPPGRSGTQVGLLCNSCFLQSLTLNQFCLVKRTNQCPILIIQSCSGYCGSFMAFFMGMSSAIFTYITRRQETVMRVMWGCSYTQPACTHASERFIYFCVCWFEAVTGIDWWSHCSLDFSQNLLPCFMLIIFDRIRQQHSYSFGHTLIWYVSMRENWSSTV